MVVCELFGDGVVWDDPLDTRRVSEQVLREVSVDHLQGVDSSMSSRVVPNLSGVVGES
ncbi:MAG: hypothetical protein J07HX64_02426 [halophilic archaeon J07HX64]|nr:MAG: hypothetical protein J07HX64_02426 [halophilic archaeon J07HX64]